MEVYPIFIEVQAQCTKITLPTSLKFWPVTLFVYIIIVPAPLKRWDKTLFPIPNLS
jgi:hypothetical protein